MGVMRFLVYPESLLDDWDDSIAPYISGMDGRVFPTRVVQRGNQLECTRQQSDSGRLNLAWPVPEFGSPVLCTSSLREREQPYHLSLELARGKISQVRDQLGAWEVMGMRIPSKFRAPFKEAHRLFSKAISSQSDPEQCAEFAVSAIAEICQASEILAQSYAEQQLAARRQRMAHAPVSLGCDLGLSAVDEIDSSRFCSAFSAAIVPVEWRIIEPVEGTYHWETNDQQLDWCEKHRLLPCGGPLLDLSPGGLPDWLFTWESDLLNLQSFVCDFVETAISRYMGRIRQWEISACGNTGGVLTLSEESRLALVARSLETAHQVDEEIQLMIRVDQPWGAYQVRGQHRLSPLQFVDALLRSGVGLSRVNLEISVGFQPHGSAYRDLLEFSRLVDLWSCLGVPLQLTLAFPTASGTDRFAHPDVEVGASCWKTDWTEQAQADWIRSYLPLLMSKPAVIGVFWSQWADNVPHRFPHSGLIRMDATEKPSLQEVIDARSVWHGSGDTNKA